MRYLDKYFSKNCVGFIGGSPFFNVLNGEVFGKYTWSKIVWKDGVPMQEIDTKECLLYFCIN